MGIVTENIYLVAKLSWDEIAGRISDIAVGVIPIGTEAKEHGYHLPMNTDYLQAK